jgi:hypothetical protein
MALGSQCPVADTPLNSSDTMSRTPHSNRPAANPARASLGGVSAVVLLALTLHTVFGGRAALAAQGGGMRDGTLIRHLAVVATKHVQRLTKRQSTRPDSAPELVRLAAAIRMGVSLRVAPPSIGRGDVEAARPHVWLGERLLNLPPPRG